MNTAVKLKLIRLAQATLALVIALEFVALTANFTTKQTVLLILSLMCAVIPFGLLWEVRLILNEVAKRFSTAKLTPKKLSALDAIGAKSLTLVKPITHPRSDDLEVNEYLINREHYLPNDVAVKDMELFLSAVKIVKSWFNPDIITTSGVRKHGNQKIVFVTGPTDKLLAVSADLWDQGHVRKLTAADRKFFKAQSAKKQATDGVYSIALGYRLASEEAVTILGLVTMTDPRVASLPELTKTETRLTRQAIIRTLRGNLASASSQLVLVCLSVAGLAIYHLPPVITFMQIVALDLLLCAPIAALAYENTYHKINKIKWRDPAAFGILTAVIAYGNYLLFFSRHNLSPFYIDASLPMYHQATSLTLLTVLFCSFAWLLFERADHHEQFFTEHLHSNDKLLQGFILSIVLVAAVVYLPWLQSVFSTASLDIVDWSSALVAACVYALARLVQRHTRKHTRHAVLKLHRQTR